MFLASYQPWPPPYSTTLTAQGSSDWSATLCVIPGLRFACGTRVVRSLTEKSWAEMTLEDLGAVATSFDLLVSPRSHQALNILIKNLKTKGKIVSVVSTDICSLSKCKLNNIYQASRGRRSKHSRKVKSEYHRSVT